MCRLELSLAKSTWRQTSLSLGDLGCFGKKHGPPARHGMCAYAHSVPAVVGDKHCRGCNGDACLGTQIVTPAVPAKPYGVSPLTAYVHRAARATVSCELGSIVAPGHWCALGQESFSKTLNGPEAEPGNRGVQTEFEICAK